MGFTPNEVYEMSLWEFKACCDGWNIANGGTDPSKPTPPSDDEFWEAVQGEGIWRK